MLLLAWAQGLLHILMRTAARSAAAAAALDTGALLAALAAGLQALRASALPPSLGGSRVSLRRLFRPDGFFGYADERQAEVRGVGRGCASACALLRVCPVHA